MKAAYAILLALGISACSRSESPQSPEGFPAAANVEDGGTNPSEGRDKVNDFFKNLKRTETGLEEEKVLIEFAEWLKANGYQIEVEVRDGIHRMTCPYFPPITPWIDYRFRSIENLKIIPHRLRHQPE